MTGNSFHNLKVNPQDDNPAHDWVVLYGEAVCKDDWLSVRPGSYQHKTFQFEYQAFQFAEIESRQYPSKLYNVGHLDKTTEPGQLNIIARYKAGENLTLKPIIEQCRIIINLDKEEELQRVIGNIFVAIVALIGLGGIGYYCFTNFDPGEATVLCIILYSGLCWVLSLSLKVDKQKQWNKSAERDEEIRSLHRLVKNFPRGDL